MDARLAADAGAAPHTGTTIVACCFDGGVVLGADTRVTTGALACSQRDARVALTRVGARRRDVHQQPRERQDHAARGQRLPLPLRLRG
jgi:hypothetical protein